MRHLEKHKHHLLLVTTPTTPTTAERPADEHAASWKTQASSVVGDNTNNGGMLIVFVGDNSNKGMKICSRAVVGLVTNNPMDSWCAVSRHAGKYCMSRPRW